ncbi:hypothetical protein AC579_409 [Pseudocercospora musae]|uniref:Uncharacterized protein n=1 Tax=Pseudocercospora musae TaxID=113226 RepID=A0A139GY97_9PEZI|nr:hypothetical protein AC579_409 [Pseudocercospora musae]
MPQTSIKKPGRGKRVQQIMIEVSVSSEVEVADASRNIFLFLDLSAELRNQISNGRYMMTEGMASQPIMYGIASSQ